MQTSLVLPHSPRLEISILLAAHSAISTHIVQNENTRDLSRLGLVRFELNWSRIELGGRQVSALTSLRSTVQTPAGTQYFYDVVLSSQKHDRFATVSFEILERRRGVKSSVLTEFSASSDIDESKKEHSWTLTEFCSRFADFKVDAGSGLWPIEALVLLLLSSKGENDCYRLDYHAKGVAELKESVSVLKSASPNAAESPLQIAQGSHLIGQLN